MDTEKVYSLTYMHNGFAFSMHILATEKEIEQHAQNLNGAYHLLTGVFKLPDDMEWDEGRIDIIGQNGNDGLHYEN